MVSKQMWLGRMYAQSKHMIIIYHLNTMLALLKPSAGGQSGIVQC